MQNLPQEVGRDIVAYGDSRYLRSMPLRTQQYRIHIRYACSIKLTTYPRYIFRLPYEQTHVYYRELICKKSISNRSQKIL